MNNILFTVILSTIISTIFFYVIIRATKNVKDDWIKFYNLKSEVNNIDENTDVWDLLRRLVTFREETSNSLIKCELKTLILHTIEMKKSISHERPKS
jgi:hypothetical protein